ncbi:MAG: FtsX-like permease family protein [Gemmatimonadetes bacterium]|nr:FtsX-like permease family protein [Gemmatimonadota bacterium]
MPRMHLRPALALSLALRGLVRGGGSTLAAVAILALGTAAPATFFSFLVGATRPLPVPEGDRVVRVDVVQPSGGGRSLPVTLADLELLEGAAGLDALGGFQVIEGTVVDPQHAAARFSGAVLTPDVLPLLRVAPALGRLPAPEDAGEAFLLGYALWQEMYQGNPAAVGRTVEVNGTPRTIVGVLPEGFGFPFKQRAWILAEPGLQGGLELVGRLSPGATRAAVAAELGPRWLGGDPVRAPEAGGGVVRVAPYTGSRGESGEAVAFGGLVLVGLCLLLIACANVANLLLVRATERVRALAVQAALGASRTQIGVQLLAEAMLVSAAGGALGLVLAWLSVGAVQKSLAEEHFGYFWMRLAVDGPVVLFVGVLVAGTALVAGVLPAVRVAAVDLHRVLKEEGVGALAVGGGGPWSRAFVTVQLALSCGALVAAGLTGRALAGSRDFGRGLPVDEVVTAYLDPRSPATGTLEPGRLQALEDALGALPGASAAALALGAPGYGERFSRVEIEGVAPATAAEEGSLWNGVTPGFFSALGIQIRSGRLPAASDGPGEVAVAVESEDFARRRSRGAPVLGRRSRVARADSAAWLTVVGVVEDIGMGPGTRVREDRVYVPLAQLPPSELMAIVRARGDPGGLAAGLREAVAQVSPDIAVWDVRTLAQGHAYMMRVPRALSGMAVAGGLAGLLVAGVGLYGLLAFAVRQRRREMGVRLSLGADGCTLAWGVLKGAVRQLVPAVIVGLLLAWAAAPVLSAFLMGTDPRSPEVFVGVGLGFLAAGVLAAFPPALRAAAVDPARVLRGD